MSAKLKKAIDYFFIVFGSAVYAAGFQFFMFPNSIVSGGVTGIAMIINRLVGLPVGATIIVMNIPLFIVAWKHFGTDFLLGSLTGMFVSSLFVDLFAVFGFSATSDPMLAAIIGGVIKGAGLGIVYYVGATTGGIDIVAKFLRVRFPQINFGTIVLALDVVVIGLYAVIMGSYENAMYSMIAMFVVSKVVDVALYGIDNSCVCYIISEKSHELAKDIMDGAMRRGVTILDGEGAYSHEKKHVIMCVIKRNQIGQIRRLIKAVDPNAFFIVSDAKNVFGKGFDSITEDK